MPAKLDVADHNGVVLLYKRRLLLAELLLVLLFAERRREAWEVAYVGPVWYDWRAGDAVGLVALRRLEGDIVAEALSVNHHEVGAGREFFNEGDAVHGAGNAVELPKVISDIPKGRLKV